MTIIAGYLHEDLGTYSKVSVWVSLTMRNVSDKSCTENQKSYFIFIFFSENHTVYEIMWKNMLVPDRPQMTTGTLRRMR